ncbi:MAG TPA: zinc ribbon domain-containing protein [Candidatus Elarobacter sp.]|nr:zinc ribbon domain-containing protein [Candidatus Elarobacter sp.]
MSCPNCGAPTDARFCPNCGGEVWRPPPPDAPRAAGPGPLATVADSPEIRNWAMGAHLSALAGLFIPFGNIAGPLVVWLVKREQSPLVDREGKESLNFQISCTIYAVISALLIFVLIGFPLLIAVGVFNVVFAIVAAVKVSNGQPFRYPLTIRFLR